MIMARTKTETKEFLEKTVAKKEAEERLDQFLELLLQADIRVLEKILQDEKKKRKTRKA